MRFWLGTARPHWLRTVSIPLCVSRETLSELRTLPRAAGPWVLDSGAFTVVNRDGDWTLSPAAYAADVERYAAEVGRLEWAGPQDWMCEPVVLARTGLTLAEHQRRTIVNYLELRGRTARVIPALQGWEPDDYLRHVEQYAAAGVDLDALPLVGVGTVCRRQDMTIASRIMRQLAALGLRLHGFGIKLTGLREFGDAMVSADSFAWSFDARMPHGALRGRRMRGCTHGGKCTHCLRWALRWRERALQASAQFALALG